MSRVVKASQETYIACDGWEFEWDVTDVLDVMCMWDRGKPVWEIAEYVGRPQCEVAILLIDLAESDHIKTRRGGVFGYTNTSSQQGVDNSVDNSKSSVVEELG